MTSLRVNDITLAFPYSEKRKGWNADARVAPRSQITQRRLYWRRGMKMQFHEKVHSYPHSYGALCPSPGRDVPRFRPRGGVLRSRAPAHL